MTARRFFGQSNRMVNKCIQDLTQGFDSPKDRVEAGKYDNPRVVR